MSTQQPRGARLLTAYSPKFGRTVRAFDHAAFKQWDRLKVDPGVISFCEHPCPAGANDDGPLINLWASPSSDFVPFCGRRADRRVHRMRPNDEASHAHLLSRCMQVSAPLKALQRTFVGMASMETRIWLSAPASSVAAMRIDCELLLSAIMRRPRLCEVLGRRRRVSRASACDPYCAHARHWT